MKYGPVAAIAFVMVALVVGTSACSTIGEERPGDPQALEAEARNFHMNMRWSRWEHASDSVHPAFRQEFMGRYEELGDDFDIVDLDLKSAELTEEGFAAILEVEQEWFQLPNTSVESERFVERWIYEDGVWRMRERMKREEYRELDRIFPSEKADKERREKEKAEAEALQAGESTDEN